MAKFIDSYMHQVMFIEQSLTHWGRETHICINKLTIIGSDNGLSPGRLQAIIWTNAGILLIRPLGTNFIEIVIENLTFSFMKMRLKVSSAKWCPFCLGLNVLTNWSTVIGQVGSKKCTAHLFARITICVKLHNVQLKHLYRKIMKLNIFHI